MILLKLVMHDARDNYQDLLTLLLMIMVQLSHTAAHDNGTIVAQCCS